MQFRGGVIAIAAAALIAGCNSAPGEPGGPGPTAVVREILAARAGASYERLRPHVLPGRADEVIATLTAVDQFLVANRALCDYVAGAFGAGLSAQIDQAWIADHLDVFSRFVELHGETIDGERATVSYSVNGAVPLQRAELVRVDGAWRYDPGPGYDPGLPEAFRLMADGLKRVIADLESGKLAAPAVRADAEVLLNEIRLRLTPGLRRLPVAPESAPG